MRSIAVSVLWIVVAVASTVLAAAPVRRWSSSALPSVATLRIVHRYSHDAMNSFTEGLTIHHERNEAPITGDADPRLYSAELYESTGLWGRSSVRLWQCDTHADATDASSADLDNNPDPLLRSIHPPLTPVRTLTLPDTVFSEGITILNGRLYLLTYQSPNVYVLDLQLQQQQTASSGESSDSGEAAHWKIVEVLTLPATTDATDGKRALGAAGGWGLTSVDFDGSDREPDKARAAAAAASEPIDVLIMSDGSDRLHVLTTAMQYIQTVTVGFAGDDAPASGAAASRRPAAPRRARKNVAQNDDGTINEFAHLDALSVSSLNAMKPGGSGLSTSFEAKFGGGDDDIQLNELEFVDGQIWANAYGTDCILRIDLVLSQPGSGEKRARGVGGRDVYSRHALVAGVIVAPDNMYTGQYKSVNVMNGIAYDTLAHRLFVTGKFWPFLYETEPIHHPSHDDADASKPLTRQLFNELCPRHPMTADDMLYSTQLLADPITAADSNKAGAGVGAGAGAGAGGLGGDFGFPADFPGLGGLMNSMNSFDALNEHLARPALTAASSLSEEEEIAQAAREESDAQMLYLKLAPSSQHVHFHKRNPKPTAPPASAPTATAPAPAAAAAAVGIRKGKSSSPANSLQPLHPLEAGAAGGAHKVRPLQRPKP